MSLRCRILFLFAVFVFALCATRMVLQIARRVELIDFPSGRSSHSKPTPRGGGMAIVLGFFLALIVVSVREQLATPFVVAIGLGGGAIAIIGFVDDLRSLPAKFRIVVHIGAAIVAVWCIGTPGVRVADSELRVWALRFLGVMSIVWATNLFNFMDGIDGIAAAETVFFAGSIGGINLYLEGNSGTSMVVWALASAGLGFLIWNWPPAKIFMGDVGSGFVGFVLAVVVLYLGSENSMYFNLAIILAGVFIVDATITLIRRIVRGDRWFEAHRVHAYQHLSRRWKSHRAVTLLAVAVNLMWLLPWACVAVAFPDYANLVTVAAIVPLVALVVRIGAGVS